jgi:integral membrane sensor domain MASE1
MTDKGQKFVFNVIRWVSGSIIGILGFASSIILLILSIYINHKVGEVIADGYKLRSFVG